MSGAPPKKLREAHRRHAAHRALVMLETIDRASMPRRPSDERRLVAAIEGLEKILLRIAGSVLDPSKESTAD